MEYLITFIEGLASFVSPCVLPVIPIYISYFAKESKSSKNTILNALQQPSTNTSKEQETTPQTAKNNGKEVKQNG